MDKYTIKESISNLDSNFWEKTISENPLTVINYLKPFSDQLFTVGDLDINRKNIHFWRKNNLLPYEKSAGWGRFSFIEFTWLKILQELRMLGVGLERISAIKEYLFDDSFYQAQAVDLSSFNSEVKEVLKSSLIKKGSQYFLSDEVISFFKSEFQFSRFSYLLIITILKRANICIFVDTKGEVNGFDLNEIYRDGLSEIPQFFRFLTNHSIVLFNVTSIIANITDSHEILLQEHGLGKLLSESNISLIKDLFKNNQVKEVSIRVSNENRPIITITRELKFSTLQSKIHELNKKGIFRDLVLKTRDGKMQYFEQKDIIRL